MLFLTYFCIYTTAVFIQYITSDYCTSSLRGVLYIHFILVDVVVVIAGVIVEVEVIFL